MILKVEDSTYPFGWSYYDGLHSPTVSGRVPLVRIDDTGRAISFVSTEDEGKTDSPHWAADIIHWSVGPNDLGGVPEAANWLVVQWHAGADTHLLVTRRSAYLMSDDGKTVDRL